MTVLWGLHNDSGLDLVDGGFVSIGWDELGDLTVLVDDRGQLKEQLAITNPGAKPGALPVWAGVLHRFVRELQVGDLVIAPQKSDSTLNFGRIDSDYFYEASAEVHRNRRKVSWLRTGVPRTEFSQAALYEIGSAVTLFRVRRHAEEFLTFVETGESPVASESPADPAATPDEAADNALALPTADRIEQDSRDFIVQTVYQQLRGYEFEHFVGHLLSCMGYRVQVTQASGDGGIDVIAHKDPLALEPPIIKVQCKKVIATMGAPDVQRLIGTLAPGNSELGLFVTLGPYSKEARALERSRQDLRLIDGNELTRLVFEHYDRFDPRWRSIIPLRRVYVVEREQVVGS